MQAAVAQLAIVERGLLGALAGEAADAGELLALALVVLELAPERIGALAIAVQPGVEMLLHKRADELADRRAAGSHVGGPELGLGLRLEDRLDHAYGDGCDDRLAHVGGIEVLLVEVAQHLDDRFAKRLLMGAAHGGVLAVDERVVFLAVVRAVRERDFHVLPLEVDDRIQNVAAEAFLEEVLETVLGPERLAVE